MTHAETAAEHPETKYGRIELCGPGVDAWHAHRDTNNSEPAEKLMAAWKSRTALMAGFLSRQKDLFSDLDGAEETG